MEWLHNLALDANMFKHGDFNRSKINKRWNTFATSMLVLIGVAAIVGIVCIHLSNEHFSFSCISETTGVSVDKYHIGMCECTDTTNLAVSITVGGDCSDPQVFIPKCVQEGSTVWLVNVQYSQSQNQWVATTPPFRGVYRSCVAANYNCVLGTCYPTGDYMTYAPNGIHGGNTGESVLTAIEFHTATGGWPSEEHAFDVLSPAVKCCGFNKETQLSQALRVLGNIGGALSAILVCLTITFSKCMSSVHEYHDTVSGATGEADVKNPSISIGVITTTNET